MAFFAPVVSEISGGVGNCADAEAWVLDGLPGGFAGVARVEGFGNFGPIDDLEWDTAWEDFFDHWVIIGDTLHPCKIY